MYQYYSYHKNDPINIYFDDGESKKTPIVADPNELLSSLFTRYIHSTRKYNRNLFFIFKSSFLNPNMTISKAGLNNFNTIRVDDSRSKLTGGGGFSLKFTDLSKQVHQDCYFTNNAPNYRNVGQGINIFGDCKCENCIAYNKEVIVPLENNPRIDLVRERGNLKCPMCKGLIEPKTLGFFLCEYNIRGKNFENGIIKPFDFKGIASNNNSFQYYDPVKNGETIVIELIIEIIRFL